MVLIDNTWDYATDTNHNNWIFRWKRSQLYGLLNGKHGKLKFIILLFIPEKWVMCLLCNFYLPSQDQISLHQCANTKGTKCKLCNFWYFQTSDGNKHVNEKHFDTFHPNPEFKCQCQLCPQVFKTRKKYHSHMT